MRWKPAKRTLRERDRIATHWSATHKQFWSALRYLTVPTEKKPVVDDPEKLYIWTRSGRSLDLYAESQEPFIARAWKQRRERKELKEAAGGSNKRARFSKLDLTAIILDQGLKTKAAVMEYTQDRGSKAMQEYVHKNQRALKEHLDDAEE
eukprot:4404171-Karenia_brevis.AAC.1